MPHGSFDPGERFRMQRGATPRRVSWAAPVSERMYSDRLYPADVPAPQYSAQFLLRRVSRAGNFRMHSPQVFTNIALVGETLGFEETGLGICTG